MEPCKFWTEKIGTKSTACPVVSANCGQNITKATALQLTQAGWDDCRLEDFEVEICGDETKWFYTPTLGPNCSTQSGKEELYMTAKFVNEDPNTGVYITYYNNEDEITSIRSEESDSYAWEMDDYGNQWVPYFTVQSAAFTPEGNLIGPSFEAGIITLRLYWEWGS